MSIVDKAINLACQKAIPLQTTLELTYECNQCCPHCYLNCGTGPLLDYKQWGHILRQLKKAGCLYLIFSGGEAMLHPDFWQIASDASSLGFHLSLITNGQAITSPSIANMLKDIGFHNISLSLFSLDAHIHEQLTATPGSHKKIMCALDWALQTGMSVGINCLLSSSNIEGAIPLIEYCQQKGLEFKDDSCITAKVDGDKTPLKFRATVEQLEKYYHLRIQRWPQARPVGNVKKDDEYICNVARGKCAISAQGELMGCVEVRTSFGNLLRNEFEDLWNSGPAKFWRGLKNGQIKNRWELKNFDFCEFCPGMSLQEYNDPLLVGERTQKLAQIKSDLSRGR